MNDPSRVRALASRIYNPETKLYLYTIYIWRGRRGEREREREKSGNEIKDRTKAWWAIRRRIEINKGQGGGGGGGGGGGISRDDGGGWSAPVIFAFTQSSFSFFLALRACRSRARDSGSGLLGIDFSEFGLLGTKGFGSVCVCVFR